MAMMAFSMPGPSAATKASARIEAREGEEDVGDPHQHRIDPAAEIAGDGADQEADGRCDQRHQHHDEERDARAVDDAGEDVPRLVVGAEPEGLARRQEALRAQVSAGDGRIGRDDIGEDRHRISRMTMPRPTTASGLREKARQPR